MRAIAFITRLVDSGFDDGGQLKKMLIHCIDGEDQLRTLGGSSKLNVDSNFMTALFDLGAGEAQHFFETISTRSASNPRRTLRSFSLTPAVPRPATESRMLRSPVRSGGRHDAVYVCPVA